MTLDEYLAQMSPEDAQRLPENLAELGVMPERQRLLDQAMARAEALRGTPMPEGRTIRNGIFVASSPLEVIGAGLSRVGGDIAGTMTGRQQQDAIAKKAAMRAAQLRAYAGAARAPQTNQPQSAPETLGGGQGAQGQLLGGATLQLQDGQPWPANLPLPQGWRY